MQKTLLSEFVSRFRHVVLYLAIFPLFLFPRFPFLEHPGHVHYLYPPSSPPPLPPSSPSKSSFPFLGGGGGDSPADKSSSSSSSYVVVRQSSQMFSRQLTVLERMVLDHLEWCYRKAFEGVHMADDD